MAKISEYIIIIIVICLVFHFTGALVETGTANSILLQAALNPATLKEGSFYAQIALIIAGMLVGGLVIGWLSHKPDLVIFQPMFYILVALGWDLIGISTFLADVNVPLAVMLVSPLLIIYVLGCIDWLRGI